MCAMTSPFRIRPLVHDEADRRSEALLALSDDLAWDDWTRTELLADRPGKWRFSRLLEAADDALVGYSIVSAKEEALHLHHIVLAAAYRSAGAGGLLVDDLIASARTADVGRVTLKVMRENARALNFYRRKGFAIEDGDAVFNLSLPLRSDKAAAT